MAASCLRFFRILAIFLTLPSISLSTKALDELYSSPPPAGVTCTMCSSCDNPCHQTPFLPPPPPPPPSPSTVPCPPPPPPPSTPSSSGGNNYNSPPPPFTLSGGGVYLYPPPPYYGNNYPTPPPPNPIVPYFPYYYHNPPPSPGYFSGSDHLKPLSSVALLFLFLYYVLMKCL